MAEKVHALMMFGYDENTVLDGPLSDESLSFPMVTEFVLV